MKLRQLECFLAVVNAGMSMSKAAQALHATQPAISKQLRLLQAEIGVALFVQRAGRLQALTPVGDEVLRAARAALQEIENIERVAAEHAGTRQQTLTLASTFSHARYMLVRPVTDFLARHPAVAVRLEQGAPDRIAQLVLNGTADVGILTRPPSLPDELVGLPCLQMKHSLVMPIGHPLVNRRALTLAQLAAYPMIGHHVTQQIGGEIQRRFLEAGLQPHYVLQAQTSDVMKAYVEAGIGIAVIPKMAFSPLRDKNLRSKDVSHLFEATTTLALVRRGSHLSEPIIEFIQALAPQLTRKALLAQVRSRRAA